MASNLELLSVGNQSFITDKRARWFLQKGTSISMVKGFSSKENASLWIESLGRKVDWRAGYIFRLRGGSEDYQIVNRDGKCAKN